MESTLIIKLFPRRHPDFSMRSHTADWNLAKLWHIISHSSTRSWPNNAGFKGTASQLQASLTFPIYISNSTNEFFSRLSKLLHHQSLCITTSEVEAKIRKRKINVPLFFNPLLHPEFPYIQVAQTKKFTLHACLTLINTQITALSKLFSVYLLMLMHLTLLFCHSYINSCSNLDLDTSLHQAHSFVTKMQWNTGTPTHIHPYAYCTSVGQTDNATEVCMHIYSWLEPAAGNYWASKQLPWEQNWGLCVPIRTVSTVKSFCLYVCKNILRQSNISNGYKHFLSNRLIPAAWNFCYVLFTCMHLPVPPFLWGGFVHDRCILSPGTNNPERLRKKNQTELEDKMIGNKYIIAFLLC